MSNFIKKRGIVLITTLMITAFLVMIASAMMISTMRQQLVASRYYQKEQALMAAEAGVNYAFMRLCATPSWEGCADGEDYNDIHTGEMEVYEWGVSGNKGVVEGKLYHGGTTSTFDLYFVSPSTAVSKMKFYDADTIPSKILLCSNHYDPFTTSDYEYSDGTYIYTDEAQTERKQVPSNRILLVCRGRCGEETRIIETCVEIDPSGDYNSVMVGRGNIDITLDDKGQLILSADNDNKPPIIRANGNISVTTDSSNTDWLDIQTNGGGGKANGSITFSPAPDNHGSSFISDAGDQSSYLPNLEWDNVVPDTDSLAFEDIYPGIYVVSPGSTASSPPTITYYATDDIEKVKEGEVRATDEPDEGLSTLLSSSFIEWSGGDTLTIKDSLKVKESSLTGLAILSDDLNPITVSLYNWDSDTNNLSDVYLYNPNGAIYVDGELSGVGTVIANGDVNLEPESQLTGNPTSGISIYANGNVNINEISGIRSNLSEDAGINLANASASSDADIKNKYGDAKQALTEILEMYKNRLNKGTLKKEDCTSLKVDAVLIGSNSDTDSNDFSSRVLAIWQLMDDYGYVKHHPVFSSKDTITIDEDTLRTVYNQLVKNNWVLPIEVEDEETGETISFKDSQFRGLIYAREDFNVDTGNNKFILEGGLVAYGDDDNGTGNISITAESALVNYNTDYLSLLQNLEDYQARVTKLYWGNY